MQSFYVNKKGWYVLRPKDADIACIGATQNGWIGYDTIIDMQKWLGTKQDGVISNPSNMVKALQTWCNNQ